MHGVAMIFFSMIPVDSRRPRQFPDSAHDRREGPGFSNINLAELVHLHRWRLFVLYSFGTGGLDTG